MCQRAVTVLDTSPWVCYSAHAFRKASRGVAQLVARMVWDHEVRGSSPRTPTCIVGDPIGISISGSNSVVEFLPSKQAVAGSSPVSRSLRYTVSLQADFTPVGNNQAVKRQA